jgi:hypothetical protein
MNFSRADSVRSDVDLIRHLSERAKAERAPGQTLQSKMNELRREYEFVAPSFSGPTSGGAAIR